MAVMDLEGKGARFGVELGFAPLDVLDAVIAAINTAADAGETFPVILEDDFHDIAVECVPDGSGWLSYPQQLTNETNVRSVVMRFVTDGPITSP
jgi:hypothetical protein